MKSPENFKNGLLIFSASVWRILGILRPRLVTVRKLSGFSRELAKQEPDAFRYHHFVSLANLGIHLRDVERFDIALEITREAEAISYDLAEKQPDAYRLDRVCSLANLSEALLNVDHFIDAIRTGRRAVELLPDLKTRPGEIRTLIAEGFCMRVLAEALLQAGELDTALAVATKAARSLEAAFAKRPDHVAEHYVQAIVTLTKCELKADGAAGALNSLEQGVTAIRPLFEKRPRALQREMQRLIDGFRLIDPSSIEEQVPAAVLQSLDSLPKLKRLPSDMA